MGLALSTDAVPGMALAELTTACKARGLDGEEVVLSPGGDVRAAVDHAFAVCARVVALRLPSLEGFSAADLVEAAVRLRVPVAVAAGAPVPANLDELSTLFAKANARLLFGHGTDLDGMLALAQAIEGAAAPEALGIAWEVRPSTESLDEAGAVLLSVAAHLGLVRLYGGGPEQRDQDGRGVGPLLVDLALARYTGPIVLSPSTEEALPRWAKWLSSTKSAGCGSGVAAGPLHVDVRDVEPRDRLGTILGAYQSLGHGATMRLTVDHNPSCMYYTLEANEPKDSFTYKLLQDGPDVWKAEVTKI